MDGLVMHNPRTNEAGVIRQGEWSFSDFVMPGLVPGIHVFLGEGA
jgi:hypothetical protein